LRLPFLPHCILYRIEWHFERTGADSALEVTGVNVLNSESTGISTACLVLFFFSNWEAGVEGEF
jgi:hypothetical protein